MRCPPFLCLCLPANHLAHHICGCLSTSGSLFLPECVFVCAALAFAGQSIDCLISNIDRRALCPVHAILKEIATVACCQFALSSGQPIVHRLMLTICWGSTCPTSWHYYPCVISFALNGRPCFCFLHVRVHVLCGAPTEGVRTHTQPIAAAVG